MLIPEKDIQIVGAGIAGLTTALALKKAGLRSYISESSSSNAQSGAGIVLSINAMNVLEHLGVAGEIENKGRVIKEIIIAAPDGKVLSKNDLHKISKQYGHNSVAIHRKELHNILSNKLPEQTILYNKKCIQIDMDNNLCLFEDDSSTPFDVLIGCDGVNSNIRKSIGLDTPSRDASQICYRGITNLSHSDYDTGLFSETWGYGKRFGFANIGGNSIYWYATFRKDQYSDIPSSQIKTLLLKEFSDWWEPIPDIISHQDNNKILRNDLYDKKPCKIWNKRNIVLLGDAIHPTTPNMGQGAGMAIESAAILANQLARYQELQAALRHYQALRYPRTKSVTQQSWHIGNMSNLHNKTACYIRNFILQNTPDWITEKSVKKLMGYNALNQ